MEHIKDYGHVELFKEWVLFGGLDKGIGLDDLQKMSPAMRHDFKYCLKVYGKLTKANKKK